MTTRTPRGRCGGCTAYSVHGNETWALLLTQMFPVKECYFANTGTVGASRKSRTTAIGNRQLVLETCRQSANIQQAEVTREVSMLPVLTMGIRQGNKVLRIPSNARQALI